MRMNGFNLINERTYVPNKASKFTAGLDIWTRCFQPATNSLASLLPKCECCYIADTRSTDVPRWRGTKGTFDAAQLVYIAANLNRSSVPIKQSEMKNTVFKMHLTYSSPRVSKKLTQSRCQLSIVSYRRLNARRRREADWYGGEQV